MATNAKKNETPIVTTDHTFDLGVCTVPLRALVNTGPIDANGRAMVLVDERHKVTQLVDGKEITFVVSMFAQRDPYSDAEAAKILAVKKEKDLRAKERKDEEQAKREREITEATRRGTEGVVAGLKLMAEIGPQLQRAGEIAQAVGMLKPRDLG